MDFADLVNISSESYMLEYLSVILFFVIVSILTIFLLVISYVLGPKNSYDAKLTEYESGLVSFGKDLSFFNVKFYLVGVLFVIFDIELIFVYPWAVAFSYLSNLGYYVMLLFFIILIIGFIYEWKKGILEWY